MYLFSVLFLAVTMAAALPAGQALESALTAPQVSPSSTRQDLEKGGVCPKIIFIYARGSNEDSNLGALGSHIGRALDNEYGSSRVWVQGIHNAYDAGVCGNYEDAGAPEPAIREMVNFIQTAAFLCRHATIFVGGYSQGSALAAAAVSRVSEEIRSKIAGVVLFGYTKNKQNNGGIPGFPAEKLKVFCSQKDLVCNGTLSVSLAHLQYEHSACGPALEFLRDMVREAAAWSGAD